MRKLGLLLALLLIPVLGLVACGDSGESDEDKIVAVIETSATNDDPANCTELVTQAFLEQTELDKGKQAVKGCESSAKQKADDPDSVEVTNVEVDGSSAVADVAFVGATYDGQTLEIALVEEDGDWKLDEIVGFAKLDSEKLASAFEGSLESEAAFGPGIASCVGDALRELPQPQAEEIMLSGSQDPLVEIVEGCMKGQ